MRRLLVIVSCVLVVGLSACGSGPGSAAVGDPVPTSTVDPAASEGVYMGIEMPGTLEHRGDCLVISAKVGLVVPVWPAGYTMRHHGDELVLYDEQGHVAARTGQEITVSGGMVRRRELGRQPCLDAAPHHFEVQHLDASG